MNVTLDQERFPELVRELYHIVAQLERMVPELHFTPDGHMVGSLGQALASYHYAIQLRSSDGDGHNGFKDGRLIQIRATQGNAIALFCQPEHLIAIRLTPDGSFEELYNGPGHIVWGDRPKERKQHSISATVLRKAMNAVSVGDRLPRLR